MLDRVEGLNLEEMNLCSGPRRGTPGTLIVREHIRQGRPRYQEAMQSGKLYAQPMPMKEHELYSVGRPLIHWISSKANYVLV